MRQDNVMKEVHKAKDAIGAKYGHNVAKMAAALRAQQKRRGRKAASLSATRP